MEQHDEVRQWRGQIGDLRLHGNSVESSNSNKVFTAKNTKNADKDLCCFFFAICVFFVVNSSSVAAGRVALLAPLRGYAIVFQSWGILAGNPTPAPA